LRNLHIQRRKRRRHLPRLRIMFAEIVRKGVFQKNPTFSRLGGRNPSRLGPPSQFFFAEVQKLRSRFKI
jgi:hypothetical protein